MDEENMTPKEDSWCEQSSMATYYAPERALLCDYTFVHESVEEKNLRLEATWTGHDDGLGEIIALVGPENVQQLPDPKPSTGYEVWGVALGLAASVWQLLGLPGAIQIGQKTRRWLQARKGRSGSLAALLPVAIAVIHEQIPDANPDINRVQAINPCSESRHAIEYQVVFLYRIYDQDGTRVYLIEVDSEGNLIQFSHRPIAMFEKPA
jgi:hypothetical protein